MPILDIAGKAAGTGIESTGKGFSEATEGLPWWAKGLIIAGSIGGGIYIIYYIVNNLITGFTGTNCNQPGSPCYTAISGYQETYNICANQYAQYLNEYLKEDSANGTGFTTAQLSQLNYLTSCMNNASKNIAKTAKQYNNNPLETVAFAVEMAMVTVAGAYGLSIIIKTLKTTPSNGSSFGATIRNAMIRNKVSNGEISVDQASGLVKQTDELTESDTTTNDAFYNDLAAEDTITSEEAQDAESTTDEDMLEDDTDTEDILSGME